MKQVAWHFVRMEEEIHNKGKIKVTPNINEFIFHDCKLN